MLKSMTVRATIAAILAGLSMSAQAIADAQRIDIPAGSLLTALEILAKQANIDLVYQDAQVQGLRTGGVTGELSPHDAVVKLLQGTPLKVRRDETSGAILIMVPASSAPTTSSFAPEGGGTVAEGPMQAGGEQKSVWSRLRLAQSDNHSSSRGSPGSTGSGAREVSAKLEEIVVTAQKREERLQDVPMSVAVLTGQSLRDKGYTQFRDFADEVAGLTYTTAGAGYTQVSLRGVTTGQDISSTVGIYVDEVPFGSSSAYVQGAQMALDVGLFDVERVEVLRGPQGTLYGAATMGGLLKYVSVKPHLTDADSLFQAGISSTHGGGVSHNLAAAVSTPIIEDKVALRASGFYSHDGGYIDNVALGRDDVNRSDVHGGRFDVRIAASEQLEVRLTAFLQNIDREGEGTVDFLVDGSAESGSLSQRRLVNEPFEQEFRLVSGTINYDFGSLALTSISSYQTADSKLEYDFSGQYLPLLRNPPYNRDYSGMGLPQELDLDKFTQEVRLGSDENETIQWLVGGFYTTEDANNRQLFSPRAPDGGLAENDLFNYLSLSKYQELAAFGNVTVRITDSFDVSGGLRYAENEQQIAQIGSGIFTDSRPRRDYKEDVATYLANARYHLSPTSTLYARYATGYRPGGPNPVLNDPVTGLAPLSASFESDTLSSYEVGAKLGSSDGRFAAELALYHIDWDDIQVIGRRGIFSVRVNAGEARVRGLEASLSARPLSGLNLRANLAYQDGELTEDAPDLRAVKGEQLPNVPKFTAAGSVDYEFGGAVRPSVGLTVKHVSERRASFNASTSFPQYILPDYTSVDLRTGVNVANVGIQFYVRNLFDERGQLSAIYRNWVQAAMQQPRTVGLSVSAGF